MNALYMCTRGGCLAGVGVGVQSKSRTSDTAVGRGRGGGGGQGGGVGGRSRDRRVGAGYYIEVLGRTHQIWWSVRIAPQALQVAGPVGASDARALRRLRRRQASRHAATGRPGAARRRAHRVLLLPAPAGVTNRDRRVGLRPWRRRRPPLRARRQRRHFRLDIGHRPRSVPRPWPSAGARRRRSRPGGRRPGPRGQCTYDRRRVDARSRRRRPSRRSPVGAGCSWPWRRQRIRRLRADTGAGRSGARRGRDRASRSWRAIASMRGRHRRRSYALAVTDGKAEWPATSDGDPTAMAAVADHVRRHQRPLAPRPRRLAAECAGAASRVPRSGWRSTKIASSR